MLQPPPQRDEDEQHGRRVEEGHGRGMLPQDHKGHHDGDGIGVGDGGGQHDEHVHVGGAVAEGLEPGGVEVAAADELGGKRSSESKLGLQL